MKYTIAIVKNCDNKAFEVKATREVESEAFAILTNVDVDCEKLGFLVNTILQSGYGVAISED